MMYVTHFGAETHGLKNITNMKCEFEMKYKTNLRHDDVRWEGEGEEEIR